MCVQSSSNFNAMTGSDQTVRFYGHTKQSCWNTFLKSTNETLYVFIHLGASDLKQDTDFPFLESLIVSLYCKNKVPQDVKNVSQLRWYLFSKNQSESQKIPPTYEVLHENTEYRKGF